MSGERQTETHQAENELRIAREKGAVWEREFRRLEAELARVRAERDDWRYRAKDVERFKARADAAEARVAELEAERDVLRSYVDQEQKLSNSMHLEMQDRIDRAVAERTQAIEAWVNAWVDQHDAGDMTDDETLAAFDFIAELRKALDEFPVPTRTLEASDGT